MSDETCNGWTNYPTWAVNLWLSNDEGLYNATTELVEDAAGDARVKYVPGVLTPEETTRGDVAQRIKSWVRDDLAPDLGASFAADLLGYALDQVNWFEIADAWLEGVSAEVGS